MIVTDLYWIEAASFIKDTFGRKIHRKGKLVFWSIDCEDEVYMEEKEIEPKLILEGGI